MKKNISIKDKYSPDVIYAALSMVKLLYEKGEIPKENYEAILKKYA